MQHLATGPNPEINKSLASLTEHGEGATRKLDDATFLRDAGVDSVSVALMTGGPDQYVALMEPVTAVGECDSGGAPLGAHSRVCAFIAASAALDDFDVEVTAVDRPDVDHAATEELAARLLGSSRSEAERGGGRPIVRWRPYFP